MQIFTIPDGWWWIVASIWQTRRRVDVAIEKGIFPEPNYAHLDDNLSGPVSAQTGRHPLPDAAQFVHTLGLWGIDETKQVVAYDDAGGSIAARPWWLLRWLGHYACAVLDGGLKQLS